MKRIFKYKVETKTILYLPGDAQILSYQLQGNDHVIWAIVDTQAPEIARTFYEYDTGDRVDTTKVKYIGTLQDGSIVNHLFERV